MDLNSANKIGNFVKKSQARDSMELLKAPSEGHSKTSYNSQPKDDAMQVIDNFIQARYTPEPPFMAHNMRSRKKTGTNFGSPAWETNSDTQNCQQEDTIMPLFSPPKALCPIIKEGSDDGIGGSSPNIPRSPYNLF